MGKPLTESDGEADFCGDIFDYFATEGPELAADQPIKTFAGGRAVVQKLPIGPLLGIMPWNYPFYQIARFAAPNLMLGNTIILKHAESVPGCALAVAGDSWTRRASRGRVRQRVRLPRPDRDDHRRPADRGVSLTGSERAGAVVAAIAGKNLKKCVLELGGSDPYVMLDTDDVQAAADLAWETRISNTGQACNSNKRMIVMDDIFDGFVARLTERAKDLRPGDPPEEAEGTFAPLSSRKAAETLAEQVQDAVAKGATLHAGGVLGEGPAAYYSPAVLTGITKEMRAYREELFGPVAVVYPVASDEEALALANDTTYGLGGAVFSTDTERATKVAAAPRGRHVQREHPRRRRRGGAVRRGQAQRIRPRARPAGHGRVRQQADVLRSRLGMQQPLRVLVSAGAAGIGAAIADRFRADGALVSICDRDEAAVHAVTTRDRHLHGDGRRRLGRGRHPRWVVRGRRAVGWRGRPGEQRRGGRADGLRRGHRPGDLAYLPCGRPGQPLPPGPPRGPPPQGRSGRERS